MFTLKEIRIKKKLTRQELSIKSGVHHETIRALETGINDPSEAKLSTLIKLASALHCKVRDFYPQEKLI